jgi:hypothetical protein
VARWAFDDAELFRLELGHRVNNPASCGVARAAGFAVEGQRTPVIKKWLLAHPRFHLHFTRTSSSWLNLVERWFAELTQKKLKRGVHRSVQALERDIRSWLADWNDDPRPFVWTKTADEILDKVAAYCRRISDSGH